MEEDKQIYTTARSEEIKRQIKALFNSAKKKLKSIEEKNKAKKKEPIRSPKNKPLPPIETKTQNIQINASDYSPVKKENSYKKSEKMKGKNTVRKELIFSLISYGMLALIIMIIALGIFLTYYKK